MPRTASTSKKSTKTTKKTATKTTKTVKKKEETPIMDFHLENTVNEIIPSRCTCCLERRGNQCAFMKVCSYECDWDWIRGGWSPIATDETERLDALHQKQEAERQKAFALAKAEAKAKRKKAKKEEENTEEIL